MVARFVEAFETGDLDRLVAVLTGDVRLTMPPEPVGFRGATAVAEFLWSRGLVGQGVRFVPTRANNQPPLAITFPTRRPLFGGRVACSSWHCRTTASRPLPASATRVCWPSLVYRAHCQALRSA